MDKKVYFISDDGRQNNRGHIYHDGIKVAPHGYKVTIQEPAKSRDQEQKYHAMIRDISKVFVFMGRKWDEESCKRLLVDAFVREMREEAKANGWPDPFKEQGQIIPSLDGSGFVQLGVQTRGFTKKIASAFIEKLYQFGSDINVIWSDTSKYVIDEHRKGKR